MRKNPLRKSVWMRRKVRRAQTTVGYWSGRTEFFSNDLDHDLSRDQVSETTMDLIVDLFHLNDQRGADSAREIAEQALRHFYAEGGDGREPDDLAQDAAEHWKGARHAV